MRGTIRATNHQHSETAHAVRFSSAATRPDVEPWLSPAPSNRPTTPKITGLLHCQVTEATLR